MKRALCMVPVARPGVAAARGGGTGNARAGDRWLTVTDDRPEEDVRVRAVIRPGL
ncbi:hypothetical protein ABZ465_07965 [Streptomyces griseoincarnatus]